MGDENKLRKPRIVMLAGPNGAGKSTSAPRLLQGALGVEEFVNADVIAQGLSGFAPDRVALAAGRVMMRRLKELARSRVSFAFETTLAGRSFAPWLRDLAASDYEIHLVFLWLPSAETAIARVAERVRSGGHDIPVTTIRRRYQAGIKNFFCLYRPLLSSWQIIDNSKRHKPELVAAGHGPDVDAVRDEFAWQQLRREAGHV